MAETVELWTTTGTWTCPAGVTSVLAECWGGGGAGGGVSGKTSAGAGGAGGAYAKKQVSVTPGNTYTVNVGAVITGSATAKRNGNPTWFGTTATVYAQGGEGGSPVTLNYSTGSPGFGSGSSSIGDVVYSGGSGAYPPDNATSGGGGGGAGSTGQGNAASGSTGASAVANYGGRGGDGKSMVSAAGNAGYIYGGAGGGACTYNSDTNRVGGMGNQGLIRLTYSPAGDGGFIMQQV